MTMEELQVHDGGPTQPPLWTYAGSRRERAILKTKKILYPFLRPRLTWRYVLCSLVVLYVSYCFILGTPFFSMDLPQYSGPHSVGTIDVEVPFEKPRNMHSATFKHDGQPAFRLDTVLFTMYYPAMAGVKSTKPRHYWVPKPLALTAEGYAKFAHINNFLINKIFTGAMGLMVGGRRIPALVDVPMHEAITEKEISKRVELLDETNEGFPVVVFSHGMASSRTDYTHYCGELASRGYVVAAIEHRDGSCPGTTISFANENKPPRELLTFGYSDVQSEDDPSFDSDAFKLAQLAFREAEIAEVAQILTKLNTDATYGTRLYELNSRNEGVDFPAWYDRLATRRMLVGGHSFGATGALQALKPGPKSQTLPFHGAIVLDPGKSSGRLNTEISVPILVVHSNSWSSRHSIFYGRPHFEVVREIVEDAMNNTKEKASWFLTSLGTSHPSVTDAPLIEPTLLSWTTGASIDVYEGVRQYVHVSEDFIEFVIDGKRQGLLNVGVSNRDYNDKDKNNPKIPQEWRKYWQIHVAPEPLIDGQDKEEKAN